MMKTLKDQFNEVSEQFDRQRPKLIPCFHDFYTIALPLIDRIGSLKTVLDIGAGTGLFTQFVYEHRPDLQFTLVDISAEMLRVARQRFAGTANVSFQEADFSAGAIEGSYDLIISALAIHHLADPQKEALYKKIFTALNPGGMLINADQVEGRSAAFDDYYKSHWKETVFGSGLDQEAIERAMERIKLDKFARLDAQLDMLDKVGFKEVDVIYKHNNFVVFAGWKLPG